MKRTKTEGALTRRRSLSIRIGEETRYRHIAFGVNAAVVQDNVFWRSVLPPAKPRPSNSVKHTITENTRTQTLNSNPRKSTMGTLCSLCMYTRKSDLFRCFTSAQV